MMTVKSYYCNCRGNSLEERPVQHQTVQHKKLYEKNAQMQQNVRQYFEVRKYSPSTKSGKRSLISKIPPSTISKIDMY